MLKIYLSTVAICALAGSTFAATATTVHKRHHTSASAAHTSHTSKSAHHGTASHHRRGKSARQHVVRHRYQEVPTPERYQEIQQALASKGFFKGESNGQWGADSVDAMKRFQASQNLNPDGKISSLSLIALGLGPRRLTAKSDAVPQRPGGAPEQPGAVHQQPGAAPQPTGGDPQRPAATPAQPR